MTNMNFLKCRKLIWLTYKNPCQLKSTVYDQNKTHAQTTKSWGCAVSKYLLEIVWWLLIYHEIDIIYTFDINKWEGKDSHAYY